MNDCHICSPGCLASPSGKGRVNDRQVAMPEISRKSGIRHGATGVSAFTLVEILVAMAVLAVMLLVVSQIVSSSSILASGSKKRLDAEGQARLVLSRIGEDFSRMLKRPDVDYIFSSQNGNDSMYFYSEAPAYFKSTDASANKSSVALVGYRINKDYKLERLAKGLLWSGSNAGQSLSVVYKSTDGLSGRLKNSWKEVGSSPRFDDYDGSADNPPLFQVLSEGVLRLEICFQKKDGTFTNNPKNTADGVTDVLTDITAVVVSIAVLDDASKKIIPPAKLAAISAALVDPSAADWTSSPPVLMVEKWRTTLNDPNFASTLGIPGVVSSQIRIYQRTFQLNQP